MICSTVTLHTTKTLAKCFIEVFRDILILIVLWSFRMRGDKVPESVKSQLEAPPRREPKPTVCYITEKQGHPVES